MNDFMIREVKEEGGVLIFQGLFKHAGWINWVYFMEGRGPKVQLDTGDQLPPSD